MQVARALVMAVAVAALAMLLSSGPGTRYGLWPWQTGFSLLRWATYTGLAGAVGALGLVVLLVVPKWRARAWIPVLALCVALAAAAPPLILLQQAKAAPPIHDISTDVFDPPAFVALAPERAKSPNGTVYGGVEIAAQQQKAYPDVKSLILKTPPAEAVQKAIDAARACGWEIIASDAPAGRIAVTPSGPIPLDGATVTVHVFAFPPGAIVNAVMCRAPDAFGTRCGLPGPSVPIVVGRDGSGRARLRVVPSEVGRSQASCFRGDPCGISVVSDTVFVRARVVPIAFAAPPGADYDTLRLSFGLGIACFLIGMCAWLIVRTDWSEVGEAKAPQIDNAEYADLDAIIAALPPERETLATVS